MVLLKELTIFKDGIKSYLVNKNTYIKLGIVYDAIKKFNNNKFYYNLKHTLNINNKIFKDINKKLANYHQHDIMTYKQVTALNNRIISRLLNGYDNFYYNQRYVNKEECLLFKYYRIIELFSIRLYVKISLNTHIKLAVYLFNLNYNNDIFNDYITLLGTNNLEDILEYHK